MASWVKKNASPITVGGTSAAPTVGFDASELGKWAIKKSDSLTSTTAKKSDKKK